MSAKRVVASNIIRLIKENNSSQAALASAIGLEPLAIHLYTKEKRFPKPENMDAICEFFKVPLSELFREENKEALTNEEALNGLANNLGYSLIKKS